MESGRSAIYTTRRGGSLIYRYDAAWWRRCGRGGGRGGGEAASGGTTTGARGRGGGIQHFARHRVDVQRLWRLTARKRNRVPERRAWSQRTVQTPRRTTTPAELALGSLKAEEAMPVSQTCKSAPAEPNHLPGNTLSVGTSVALSVIHPRSGVFLRTGAGGVVCASVS